MLTPPGHRPTTLEPQYPSHPLSPRRSPEIDDLLLQYYKEAARALEAGGMRGPGRLRFLVEEGAGHHEKAWAWRLSGALTFLLSPWWGEV